MGGSGSFGCGWPGGFFFGANNQALSDDKQLLYRVENIFGRGESSFCQSFAQPNRSDKEKSALRNEKLGFVLQSSQLIGTLSVLDNVLCPTFFAKKSSSRVAKAQELLDQMGLAHRMHHLPSQLSLGQKRRVALARALIMEPQLILADEPTNDLDPERAAQVADFLFGLPKQGISLVLVTHDPQLASKAQRIYTLQDQRLKPEAGNT